MKKIKRLPLLFCIAICFAVGGLGSFFTLDSIPTWYATLHKPFFNPPNSVFGPVWTFLYFLMGISLYFIWTSKVKDRVKQRALMIFFLQLALNLFWSILFFGLHAPLLAFIEILFLWASIFMTIKIFLPISKPAAYLLLPYIAWVSFAAILNLSIVILN